MPSNSADKANKIFQDRKGSCSQAIFAGYCEQLGLGKVDFETGMKIASAFSGGIARTGSMCGALTGGLMALGLKYNDAEKYNQINVVAAKLLDEFESISGSTICRKLINHDLLTEEDLQQAFKTGAFDNCTKYVEDVTKILDKLLDIEV
ncbi:MAG: C-GCAxxG-C-C family protein [Candidatus Thorarchaeota archaeon]